MSYAGNTGLIEAERRIAATKRLGLKALRLEALGLDICPESIGQLSQLRSLSLSNNQIIKLPESIGQLSRLCDLSLSNNRLTKLPESVGQLSQLRFFSLENNQLIDLPESIGQLSQLQSLSLSNNRLTDLPESIGQLSQLQALYLHGNRALDIPVEELGPTIREELDEKGSQKPPREILNYYFRTRRLLKRPLNEAKLILVGRGGAGKTSLRKRLISGEFDQLEDKTPGIRVTPWPLTLAGGEEIKLNVWDFGGQENMLATHGYFFTKRSLYVLVLNAREGEQNANIEHWLKLIDAYGKDSPALVVVNKSSQHPLDLDEPGLRKKYPFLRGFLRTDCWENVGIEPLREAIRQAAGDMPDLRTPFPAKWFTLKEKLEAMPEDCIGYDEYQKLCAANEEADVGNQETLIGFLNDLGSVLHFGDDPHLCDFGVLKPDWVTQGIYGLLTSKTLKAADGVLEISRIGALLDGRRYPKQRHEFLLSLMEKFELCFDIPHTGHNRFLIPELLSVETPALPEWETADTLGFEYHYNILPEGLLPRFIVRTHTLSEGCVRWRHGVELRKGAARALVRADVQDRKVFIAVRGPGRQPRELLAVIRHEFEQIHGGIKGLMAEEKVPVPGYPAVKLDYRKLLVREANKKATVEFETDTKSIELPLGKLLDNFEEPASRRERATHIINVHSGGKLIMPDEHYDFSHANISNSVVGAHMENVTNAIQQLPPARNDLRTALEELKTHAEPMLKQLPEETQEEAAQNLEDYVKEAAREKPRKPLLEVTGKGLLEAATTVAAMSGPIIATVEKLRGLLGY